jgi:hypothetical protein
MWCVACGLSLFGYQKTKRRLFLALFGVVLLLSLIGPDSLETYFGNTVQPRNFTIIAKTESNSGFLSVVRIGSKYGEIKVLRCDHSLLGGVYLEHDEGSIFSAFYVLDYVRFVKGEQDKRVLQIGLGIGVSAKSLIEDGYQVDIAELDPVIVEFAKQHFALPTPNNVFPVDARKYIDSTTKKYDFIVHDVFSGGLVPVTLFSIEAWQSIRQIMTREGALAINFVGALTGESTKTVICTLQKVFSNIFYYPEHPDNVDQVQNIIFFVTNHGDGVEFDFGRYYNKDNYQYVAELDTFQQAKLQRVAYCVEPVITDANNPLASYQYETALQHFHLMRRILPREFWLGAF